MDERIILEKIKRINVEIDKKDKLRVVGLSVTNNGAGNIKRPIKGLLEKATDYVEEKLKLTAIDDNYQKAIEKRVNQLSSTESKKIIDVRKTLARAKILYDFGYKQAAICYFSRAYALTGSNIELYLKS